MAINQHKKLLIHIELGVPVEAPAMFRNIKDNLVPDIIGTSAVVVFMCPYSRTLMFLDY